MDFFKLIKTRKSIRQFQNKSIEPKKIKQILETVRLAPSAGNLQAFKIWVITKKEKIRELTQASLQNQNFSSAAAILVFAADPQTSAGKYGLRGAKLYSIQDATIACAHAQLAAYALGLSGVWVGAFDEKIVKRVLKIEEKLILIAILPLGYPAEKGHQHEHKNLNELVVYD